MTLKVCSFIGYFGTVYFKLILNPSLPCCLSSSDKVYVALNAILSYEILLGVSFPEIFSITVLRGLRRGLISLLCGG